jgi:hypothetical protein
MTAILVRFEWHDDCPGSGTGPPSYTVHSSPPNDRSVQQGRDQGQRAGNAAENDLNEAWTKAEAASRQLQTIGAEGWESAKTSFAKASRELAEAWHKIHPEDK